MQPNPFAPPPLPYAPPAATGKMRVTETLGAAFDTTRAVLFRPWNLGVWFSFGLIFFLESCLEEGGGGGSGNVNLPSSPGGSGPPFGRAPFGHGGPSLPSTGTLVALGVTALVLAIALGVLVAWLGSRGEMMAIRSVAARRVDIGHAWRSTGDAASALFRFHLVVGAISFVLFVPLVALGIITFWPVLEGTAMWTDVAPALVAIGGLVFLLSIPVIVLRGLSRHFVAPLMLRDGVGFTVAWRKFWVAGRHNIGGIVLFGVIHFLFAVGAGLVGVMAGYATCCVGLFPILHQTLMSPWYVLERAWSLDVLASMGPEYDLIDRSAPPPGWYGPYGYPQPAAAYDPNVYPPPPAPRLM